MPTAARQTSKPTELDPLEAQLWSFACALTGDRAQATRVLCTVLASAERPGRAGRGAPVGRTRLMRAVAVTMRTAQPSQNPPFEAHKFQSAAVLWTRLYALPRAERIAWTIATIPEQPMGNEELSFVMGAASDDVRQLLTSATSALSDCTSALTELRAALAPNDADDVAGAMIQMRTEAQRRWRRSGLLLILAFIAFAAIFGSIMLDLVSRDTKDQAQRDAFDRAQREFSNPMPSEERSP